MSIKRKSYTLEQKLEVIELVEQNRDRPHYVADLSNQTGISTKCIYQWVADRDFFPQTKNKVVRKRLQGGGSPAKHKELEQKLLEWLISCREKKQIVTYTVFKKKALEINGKDKNPNFRCSNSFVRGFMRRNKISYRKPTHRAQENNKKPEVKCTESVVFLNKLNCLAQCYSPDFILNMDETPVYFDHLEKSTMEFTGTKSVDVHLTGNEKSRFTVVITITASGKLLPFYVILKGLTMSYLGIFS